MKIQQSRRTRVFIGAAATAIGCAFFASAQAAESPDPPVITAMQQELSRSMDSLSGADPATYFISYTVADDTQTEVSGSNGALVQSDNDRNRYLEVQTRVGSYQLDDTHKISGGREDGTSGASTVSLDDDIPVLRREMWRQTDRQYRESAEALIRVKTSQQVQVQTAEGNALDFSHEQPHVSITAPVSIRVDRKPWEDRVRRYTAEFSKSPVVLNSLSTFTALAHNQYQV